MSSLLHHSVSLSLQKRFSRLLLIRLQQGLNKYTIINCELYVTRDDRITSLIHTAGDGHVLSMCFLFSQRYLPREVDPLVYNMSHEDPGSVSYSEIGGLSEQIRELREVQQTLQQSVL